MRKRVKVAFLPATAAGHPISLAEQVEKLGYEVRLWQLEVNPFGYGANQAIFQAKDRFLKREFKRIKALAQVVMWADVIHCTFGSTLAPNSNLVLSNNRWSLENFRIRILRLYERMFLTLELKIYRISKKNVVLDYQGDDIRQRSFQIENYNHSIAHVVDDGYYTDESDAKKKKRLLDFIDHEFKIYALNPDLLHYLPKNATFIPYSNVVIPERNVDKAFPSQGPLVFVHAPSNRTVKGTNKIIEIFSDLKAEGVSVELKLVEGLKNDDALKIYEGAFMAIDQLNAGWYGGFSVECMARGIPVISYIRDLDLHFLPASMKRDLPVINACACTLKKEIILATKILKKDYEKLSNESYTFVQKWHNPGVIASEIVKRYQ